MMVMDFKKTENLTKQIQKMYQDYKATIESTIKNLQETVKRRVEGRQLECKEMLLLSRNHKASLEKMNGDLSDIKAENNALLSKLK